MTVLSVLIERPPEQVWALLADGHSYAEWVVGTKEICEVDRDWPRVGSSIAFTVGAGPLTFSDRTTVRLVEPERHLELEARAKWLGTARIAFDIRPWGEHTLVTIDEHPLRGPSARLHNALFEVALRLRNRLMLRRLADTVAKRSP